MKTSVAVVLVAVSLAFVSLAQAAEPSTIMGKWIGRTQNGKGLITEFSPTSMAFYPGDETGKPLGQSKTAPVTYKDLGGENIAVTIANGGGGLIIQCKSANVITVDFPGLAALDLARLPSN